MLLVFVDQLDVLLNCSDIFGQARPKVFETWNIIWLRRFNFWTFSYLDGFSWTWSRIHDGFPPRNLWYSACLQEPARNSSTWREESVEECESYHWVSRNLNKKYRNVNAIFQVLPCTKYLVSLGRSFTAWLFFSLTDNPTPGHRHADKTE